MSEELELKYDADDLAAVARWLDQHFPPPTGHPWRTKTTTDTYFDTLDGALESAGLGARLRRSGRRTTVGLKSDISVRGALHRRREFEAAASESLRAAEWPPSEARALVERVAGGRPLVARLTIRQHRRERRQQMGNARVLFSLDDAQVLVDGTSVGRLRQLEIELLEGRRSTLLALRRAIAASGLLRPQPMSKLAIARRLAAGATSIGGPLLR